MTALWARIEPLLGQVQKPARYIGCEDGAVTPRHGPGTVSWLLAYPDTYEIGLPNQGLQILYEILNERDDAVAERTYAPWRDLDALLRAARRAAVLRRHPPRRRRVRPAGVQPVVGAGVHERARDDRPRRRPGARRRPPPRAPARRRSAGTAAFNPEPLADFVDARRARRGRGGRRRDHRGRRRRGSRGGRADRERGAARARPGPRRLRAVAVRGRLRRPGASPPSRRATPTCPPPSTSARSPTSASGRTRSTSSSR